MICPVCGTDNNETFPSADGIIYCRHCGEPLNDCCFCGSRKGVYKAKEIDEQIKDDSLALCEFCKENLKEDRRR